MQWCVRQVTMGRVSLYVMLLALAVARATVTLRDELAEIHFADFEPLQGSEPAMCPCDQAKKA